MINLTILTLKKLKSTNHHQMMTNSDIKTNRIQDYRNLQKDSKNIIYAIENLSRTILNKARK